MFDGYCYHWRICLQLKCKIVAYQNVCIVFWPCCRIDNWWRTFQPYQKMALVACLRTHERSHFCYCSKIWVGLDEDVWWRQGCGGWVSGWCSLIRNGNICLLTQQMVSLLSADDKTPLSPGLDIHRQLSVFIDNDFRPDNGYNISYTPPRHHHYHASTGHLIYNIKIKGTGVQGLDFLYTGVLMTKLWRKMKGSEECMECCGCG